MKNRAVRNFATKVISAFTTDCNTGGTFSKLVGLLRELMLDEMFLSLILNRLDY